MTNPRAEQSASPLALKPPPFRLHHASISAADLPRTLSFYRHLGFESAVHYKAPDGSIEIVHLALGGEFLEIFYYGNHEPLPTEAAVRAVDLPRVGNKHFALRVPSLADACRYFDAVGIDYEQPIKTGKTGIEFTFVTDPNGIEVEIVQDDRALTA